MAAAQPRTRRVRKVQVDEIAPTARVAKKSSRRPINSGLFAQTHSSRSRKPVSGMQPHMPCSRFVGKERSVTILSPAALEIIRCLLHRIPVDRLDVEVSEEAWEALMALLGAPGLPYLPLA